MKKSALAGTTQRSVVLAAIALFAAPVLAELPEQAFTIARMAIEEAQEVNAETVAGDELLLAERKLQEARDASADDDDEEAERLLEQAVLHAEYAEARAMHANAELSLSELNEALLTLGTEIGRSTNE